MNRLVGSLIFLSSSLAFAGVGDYTFGQVYTVPGVLQTAYLTTVFQCTNVYPTGFGTINMVVEVFDAAGQPAGSASVALGGGATGMISTGSVLSLSPQGNTGTPNGTQGSARIIGSTKLNCAAYVISPNSAPGYMNTLPILYKNRQRGQ